MAEVDWDRLYQHAVMIVDDSRSFRQLVNALLCHVGFKNVHCVGSCDEAVEMFKAKKIELTFLDIDMPEKNGLETLKMLRENNGDAYVVMLTGHNTDGYIEKAKQSGAKAFIPKPFSGEKVQKILEDYARQRQLYKR